MLFETIMIRAHSIQALCPQNYYLHMLFYIIKVTSTLKISENLVYPRHLSSFKIVVCSFNLLFSQKDLLTSATYNERVSVCEFCNK